MAQIINLVSERGLLRANVIFVHGLGGDPLKTWTSPPPPEANVWPKWLSEDIEGLSVWSVGYDAPVTNWSGYAMHLADRGENIFKLLLTRPELRDGELIFVGHSLGGLVIKQMLRKAAAEAPERADAHAFIERVRKVAFLATPHLGAGLADWGDRMRVLFRPSAAIGTLLRNDSHLRDLNVWYRGWTRQRGIDHLILYETKNTPLFGMIVEPDSSDPGLAANPTPVDADHVSIAKPASRDSEIYRHLVDFIRRRVERPVSIEEKKIDEIKSETRKSHKWTLVAAGAMLLAVVAVGLWLMKSQEAGKEEIVAQSQSQYSQVLAAIAREKGIPVAPLQAVLSKLGEKGVKEEDIPKKLQSAADELVKLRAENDLLKKGPPQIAAIAKAAQALIDKGEFDKARAEMSRGREAARALREGASRTEAQFMAQEARVDHLQLAYRAAAEKYGQVASLIAPFDIEAEANWYLAQAGELYDQGNEFGDNDALREALSVYRRCLDLWTRERAPLQWAMTQNNLGNALTKLGERESGTVRLEEAVAAFRAALQEFTRERAPVQWAMTHNNLGSALLRIGERESGKERVEEAVATFRTALQEFTRERDPVQWAMTQQNLAAALFTLGSRESGTARLEESVAAFRSALQEFTRERPALQWAAAQNNLGNALQRLGEREIGTARLEESVAALRSALQEFTRERAPVQWATVQISLGGALRTLGERESGTVRLEEAVVALRSALQEFTRERAPVQWAMTQYNLGNALRTLGERESGTVRLEEAIAAFRAALQEFTRERAPVQWAMTQHNLGGALSSLGQRKSGTARLEEAATAFRAALEELTERATPYQHEVARSNLAHAEKLLSERRKAAAPPQEQIGKNRNTSKGTKKVKRKGER